MWIEKDPFNFNVNKQSEVVIEQARKVEGLKEKLKGSHVIQEYKQYMQKQCKRVPGFIKNVFGQEKNN